MISIIASVGKNNELGKDGKLIWNLPGDLKFFKKLTINHVIVMGRKTFESMGKALPNRYNIVISKELDNTMGVEVTDNFEDILDRFEKTEEDVYIIGGESLYNYFLPYASKIYLTEINDSKEADVYFPTFNKEEFNREELDEPVEENGVEYRHVLYERKKQNGEG
jgi:dihydrofolate reductase